MENALLFLAVLVSAYFIGGFPAGYLLGKAKGLDVRREGSGSAGATNVVRTMGIRWAVAVLIADSAKGAGVAYAAKYIFAFNDLFALAAVFAAVLGHVFPVFFRFGGGKGVATITGGLMVIAWNPVLILAVICFWVVILLWDRKMSFANLFTYLVAVPVCLYVVYGSLLWYLIGLGILFFLAFTHRKNVARLFRGQEKKLF